MVASQRNKIKSFSGSIWDIGFQKCIKLKLSHLWMETVAEKDWKQKPNACCNYCNLLRHYVWEWLNKSNFTRIRDVFWSEIWKNCVRSTLALKLFCILNKRRTDCTDNLHLNFRVQMGRTCYQTASNWSFSFANPFARKSRLQAAQSGPLIENPSQNQRRCVDLKVNQSGCRRVYKLHSYRSWWKPTNRKP